MTESKQKGLYKEVVGTVNWWLFIALLIALPYRHWVYNSVWVAWLATWALEGRWMQRPRLSKEQGRGLLPMVGLAGWIVWEALSGLWAADAACSGALVGRHVSLLAVLLVGLWGTNEQYKSEKVMHTIVISACASVGVYLFAHFWLMNYSAALSDECQVHRHIDWAEMMDLTFAMKHRLYYATWLTIGLVGLAHQLPTYLQRWGKWQGYTLSTLAAVWLLAGIYWSGSRMSLITVNVLVCIWLIRQTPSSKRLATMAGCAVVAFGLAAGVWHWHPRFVGQSLDDLVAFDATQGEPANEPRVAIWHVALETPQEYALKGLGAGNSKAYLTEKYTEKGWKRMAYRQYGAHSQYLTEAIELGMVAALLFLLLWLALPFCQRGKARTWAIYAITILALNMTTESMLERIDGILITCIVLLITNRMMQEEKAPLK